MDDQSPVTLRPPRPRVVQVCVIDADQNFCALFEQYLELHCSGSVKFAGAFDRIPAPNGRIPAADAVVFDPRNPDFVRVDGIDNALSIFGEHVTLIARLPEETTQEEAENLEASGITIGVAPFDFAGIASALNEIVMQPAPATTSHTSVTPLRPFAETLTISIIDADPIFTKSLAQFLNQRLPGMLLFEETFDEIPSPDLVRTVADAVIFDPELDDFRKVGPAITRLREAYGEETALIAHTDAWAGKNRLRDDLKAAGVRFGVARSDFNSIHRIVGLLMSKEPLDIIAGEFG